MRKASAAMAVAFGRCPHVMNGPSSPSYTGKWETPRYSLSGSAWIETPRAPAKK